MKQITSQPYISRVVPISTAATSSVEVAQQASKVAFNILKLSMLAVIIFILIASILYIRLKIKEKSQGNIEKIKVILRQHLRQGKKPFVITQKLIQVYSPGEVREAMRQVLQELTEK